MPKGPSKFPKARGNVIKFLFFFSSKSPKFKDIWFSITNDKKSSKPSQLGGCNQGMFRISA